MTVDRRAAAQALAQIAAYLELHGENRFKTRAYESAARAIRGVDFDDLTTPLESGELGAIRGLGPATLAVIRDLVEQGQSLYLEQLRTTTPDGLLEMLRVPGLTGARVFAIHQALGITTVEELEQAARDGRLATVPRYGKKTVDRILGGIAFMRANGGQRLYHHARLEGERLLAIVLAHPDVARAAIAGPLRRRCETVGAIDIVAACTADAKAVAASFTRIAGVKHTTGAGSSVEITFVDGVTFRLHCAPDRDFGFALFVATGSTEHVAGVVRRLIASGLSLGENGLQRGNSDLETPTEHIVYDLAGLQFVDAAMREDRGEIDAAAEHKLPTLVGDADIRGVLHCHTVYSDGAATIQQMAAGAKARGWSYLGVSDHSKAAFYAGGLSDAKVNSQLEEIDRLNSAATTGVRLLKGIEADILADGQLDYGPDVLGRFDFVVGAIHSRFAMSGDAMTTRLLRALDDPHLTILAHPTGRRLLAREAYPMDMDAILTRAAENGVSLEVNSDPRRLDLDWRYLLRARELGVRITISPDAHSVDSLDNTFIGVGMARKGWLRVEDVLNTGTVDDVLAFARARRAS